MFVFDKSVQYLELVWGKGYANLLISQHPVFYLSNIFRSDLAVEEISQNKCYNNIVKFLYSFN